MFATAQAGGSSRMTSSVAVGIVVGGSVGAGAGLKAGVQPMRRITNKIVSKLDLRISESPEIISPYISHLLSSRTLLECGFVRFQFFLELRKRLIHGRSADHWIDEPAEQKCYDRIQG